MCRCAGWAQATGRTPITHCCTRRATFCSPPLGVLELHKQLRLARSVGQSGGCAGAGAQRVPAACVRLSSGWWWASEHRARAGRSTGKDRARCSLMSVASFRRERWRYKEGEGPTHNALLSADAREASRQRGFWQAFLSPHNHGFWQAFGGQNLCSHPGTRAPHPPLSRQDAALRPRTPTTW